MKKRSCWSLLVLVLFWSAVSIVSPGSDVAVAQEAPKQVPTREQVEKRLTSVDTLIERSSAAKQIEASGIAEAEANRNLARQFHRQAGEAYRSGDYEKATRLLEDASKKMFEAVRVAAPDQVTGQKKRRDFDARLDSVKALQEALKRINQEKQAGTKGKELVAKIDAMTREAVQLAESNNLERARALLDQAYLAAKVGVGGMREGDTLVRSLKFESKEEEYRYELDRNDTHQMLVKVLLEEKRTSASVDAMVKTNMEQALKLRKTADESAAKGDYDSAIKTLEESTRELVKAIRNAGVYIPG